jgi:hypothetical protein
MKSPAKKSSFSPIFKAAAAKQNLTPLDIARSIGQDEDAILKVYNGDEFPSVISTKLISEHLGLDVSEMQILVKADKEAYLIVFGAWVDSRRRTAFTDIILNGLYDKMAEATRIPVSRLIQMIIAVEKPNPEEFDKIALYLGVKVTELHKCWNVYKPQAVQ